MRQILINTEPYEKRVAITRHGALEEFHIERTDQPRLAGNIYKGVIESIVPGIGALFVDIGTGKNGFLYIKDLEGKAPGALLDEEIAMEPPRGRALSPRAPHAGKGPGFGRLLERLKKGQELLVQVVKEPIGTKGPLLTADISLPGKYLVLMPFHEATGVSKRIEDRAERAKLKEILEKIRPPKGMGCIARTQSVGANPRHLKSEIHYLVNLWIRIQRRAEKEKAPKAVFEEYDLPLRIIRDNIDKEVEKILVDSREEYKKICRFANSIQPGLRKKIFFYKGLIPLYERFGIEERIEGVFRRKVFLKNGGSVVIEQTEGMVAIDVNTGKFTGKRNPEETAYKTNMEAASEIAKQVMLRDIGGIIIIDFIDMRDRDHRRRVHAALEDVFKRDKAKINILTISTLGVVEMTRQRVRKSLESVSFTDCPYCKGMGRVKTPATIAIEAVRRLERVLREKRSRDITLTLHPDVSQHMEANFERVFRTLERRFRKRIKVNSDAKLHVENVYIE